LLHPRPQLAAFGQEIVVGIDQQQPGAGGIVARFGRHAGTFALTVGDVAISDPCSAPEGVARRICRRSASSATLCSRCWIVSGLDRASSIRFDRKSMSVRAERQWNRSRPEPKRNNATPISGKSAAIGLEVIRSGLAIAIATTMSVLRMVQSTTKPNQIVGNM